MSASQRPGITPYALVWLGTLLAWVALILSSTIANGSQQAWRIPAWATIFVMVYWRSPLWWAWPLGHWLWKVRSAVAKDPAAMASAQVTAAAAATATPHGRMLAGEGNAMSWRCAGWG